MLHRGVLFQWTLLLLISEIGESCSDEGWIENNGNCYKIFTDKANKSVAESSCWELKSALASVSNTEEYAFLATQFGQQTNTSEENYWVGLHKIESALQWNNRASFVILPWVDTTSFTRDSSDCFIFNGAKVLSFDCSAEANYVCEKWNLSDRRPATCPPDTHKDVISDKCFWYSHMPLSKAGSEVICSLKHGRLLQMNGVFFPINIAMITTLSPPPEPAVLWTSLIFRNGTFIFEDGSTYHHDEFSYRRGEGECVALFIAADKSYELQQRSCLEEARGFCELSLDYLSSDLFSIFGRRNDDIGSTSLKMSCPHGSNWQEHPETGFCYWETSYETTRLSWTDARKYCQSYGGDLASFHSTAEEKIGLGYLAGTVEHSYWIGLYHDFDTDSYVWADGTPLDYTNWDDNQPNNVDRRMRCGYMSSIRKKWSLSYCGRLGWFICKAPKQINPKKPVPPTPEPLIKCSEDTSEYFFNGYCYKKQSLLHGWHRAQQYCENKGSNLLSLHDERELDFIIRLMALNSVQGNRLWIGLNSLSFGGAFKWTDGTPVDFTNWDTDEPNNFQNQEKCASMYSGHGMWNDENCNAVMNFICKRRNGTIPETTTAIATTRAPGYCRKDFYMFGDRCFLPVGVRKSERKNWTEAGLHCARLGGYLASVRNAKDQAFMYYLMQAFKMDTWIGLHDSIHSGVFYWNDNSPLFYTNWAFGEPSSYGLDEDCGIIGFTNTGVGFWKDTQCRRELPYICQTDRDPTITVPGTVRVTSCPELPGYLKQGVSCYKVFTNLSSWEEAEALCGKDHGHLLSIHKPESLAVANYLAAASFSDNQTTYWIGLLYDGMYPLKWANGWPLTFSRWGRNEPHPVSGKKTCYCSTISGFWREAPCSEKKAFICHVNADAPPKSVTPTKGKCPAARVSAQWTEIGASYCFLLDVRYGVEWYTANFRCFREGGYLASFHSLDILEELQLYLRTSTFLQRRAVHIGMTKNSEGGFQWADDSPVDFVNWDQDEPRNTSNKCVEMKLDTMKWSVASCDIRKYYVCGKRKANMVSPTSLPLDSSPETTSEDNGTSYESSVGLQPGAVVAIVISLIILAVAAAVVLIRVQPWKKEWNRYSVHSPGNITSFENQTYGEPNNVDINDRNVLFVRD